MQRFDAWKYTQQILSPHGGVNFRNLPWYKCLPWKNFSEMFTLSRLGFVKPPGVSTSAFPNVNSPCYLQGYLEIVRCLLEMDADANLANCNDNTPLWVASWTPDSAKRENGWGGWWW